MKIFSRILKEDCHQTINYSLLSKGFVRSYKPIQKIIAPPSQTTNEAIQNIKNESYKNSDINTLKIPKIEKVFEKEFKNEKGDSIEGYLGHNEPHVQKRKEKRTQDYDQGENSNFASKRQQDNRPRSTEDPVDSFNKRNNSGERDFRNPRDNKFNHAAVFPLVGRSNIKGKLKDIETAISPSRAFTTLTNKERKQNKS